MLIRLERAAAAAVCAVLTLGTVTVSAEDVLDRFEKREYKNEAGETLLYRLLKPAGFDGTAADAKKYPLVVFWHGAGERGSDNAAQLKHGMREFASDPVMEKYPAFVIAPQCPRDEKWANVSWSADQHSMQPEPSKSMRLSFELVDALQKEFPIDASRLYVTGLSMGGFGTWDAIQRRPKQFAAAIPICGGGDSAKVAAITGVPIWVFHGGADNVVKPARSQEMVKALKDAGGEPKYTEYPGVGHDSWTATYRNPEVIEWLFSQRLPAAE